MKKRERYFQKVEEYKERFRHLSTEKILHNISLGPTIKEALVAYREVLAERGIDINELPKSPASKRR